MQIRCDPRADRSRPEALARAAAVRGDCPRRADRCGGDRRCARGGAVEHRCAGAAGLRDRGRAAAGRGGARPRVLAAAPIARRHARWRGSSRSGRRRSTIGWSARSMSPIRRTRRQRRRRLPIRCWPTPAGGRRTSISTRFCRRSLCGAPGFRRPRQCSCSPPCCGRRAARRVRQSTPASLTLFPARVALEVTPGNATDQGRRAAGDSGAARRQSRADHRAAADCRRRSLARGRRCPPTRLARSGSAIAAGHAPPSSTASSPAPLTSPVYDVAVAHAPRVTRIDVDYTYPAGLRLPPRTESDGGDIYAPPGTDVRVHVFTDRPAATGEMALGDGKRLALTADAPTELSASLKVVDDNSYRVALADRDGMAQQRRHRILHPHARGSAARRAHPQAGVGSLGDAARGSGRRGAGRGRLRHRSARSRVLRARRAEKVVPLPIARQSAIVNGRHTLFLEDLERPAGRLRLLLRARARPHARHAAERSAQRHLLPRGQAVRAGVRAGAEPGRHGRRRRQRASTTSSPRRRKSSSRPGSSIGARAARKARSRSRTSGRSRGPKRSSRRASSRRRARSANRRCAIRGRRQPQRGRGGPPDRAARRPARRCPKKTTWRPRRRRWARRSRRSTR